jgi:selenide,water dikinase
MAEGSNVTLAIDLAKLPLLAGVDRIDVTRFRTRASKTNREYTEKQTSFEGTPDPTRLEFFYDAQTSGGLLISVPVAKADELVRKLIEAKTPAAAVIGEVRPFGGKHLVVH